MRKPSDFDTHPYAIVPPLLRGVCKYVADGDTYDIFIDNFCFEYSYKTFRLYDLDIAEIFHPSNAAEKAHGLAAKARATELILNKPVLIRTYRDAVTFDRFVAEVFYFDPSAANLWVSLAETLRAEGFAKKASYV